MTDRSSARAAKEQLRHQLGPLPGVGGIGIGRRDGGYVVTVDVVDEADLEQVPASWDGVDVEARVVGRVLPLPAAAPGPGPGSRPGAVTGAGGAARRVRTVGPGRVRTGPAGGAAVPWGSAARDAGGTAP